MDLPDWVKPGASFSVGRHARAGHTPRDPRRFHVRGIVDGQAVLREWWRSKQRWNYTIEHPYYFRAFEPLISHISRSKRLLSVADIVNDE
jgi:hypothetical protein